MLQTVRTENEVERTILEMCDVLRYARTAAGVYWGGTGQWPKTRAYVHTLTAALIQGNGEYRMACSTDGKIVRVEPVLIKPASRFPFERRVLA
jgi:hypothetical protein